MKKLLLKWLMPTPEEVAKLVAKAAADFVNNTGKQDAIVQFVDKSKSFQDAQVIITRWLADGILDEAEVKELEQKLVPAARALIDAIQKKVG